MADILIHNDLSGVHESRDAASKVLWTSTTTGYICFYDNTGTTFVVEKTTDSGASWSVIDAAGELACNPRSSAFYWEEQNGSPDDPDLLHVGFLDVDDDQAQHMTFDIGTESWAGSIDVAHSYTSVIGSSSQSSIGMAVATNGDILVVSRADQDGEVSADLYDKSAGTWSQVGSAVGNSPWIGAFQTDQTRVEVGNGGVDFVVAMADESGSAIWVRGYRVAADDWTAAAFPSFTDRGLDQQEFALSFDWVNDETLLAAVNDRGQAGSDLTFWSITWDGTDVAPTVTSEANVMTDDTSVQSVTMSFDPINDLAYVHYARGTQLVDVDVYEKYSTTGGTYSWSAESTARNGTTEDIRTLHGSVITTTRSGGRVACVFQDDDDNDLWYPDNDTEVAAPSSGVPTVRGLETGVDYGATAARLNGALVA